MKKTGSTISGWQRSPLQYRCGIFLSIALIILPSGSHGSSWVSLAMEEAGFRAILLQWLYLHISDGAINAMINVILCTLILTVALLWSYVKKILKENRTKDIAILGLREVIKILEE